MSKSKKTIEMVTEEVIVTEDKVEEIEVVKETTNVETKVEEVTNKIKFNEDHSAIDYEARGFKNLKEAYAFVDTDYFKGLGKADQDEFTNWLY